MQSKAKSGTILAQEMHLLQMEQNRTMALVHTVTNTSALDVEVEICDLADPKYTCVERLNTLYAL
jgi:hypothetical protein